MTPDVRFGIGHLPCGSRAEFAAAARRAEELGFDFLAAPDHLGVAAPFAALVAAGTVTQRIRLRTYVLNAGFWNPALLVREAATADLLTDGRLELGLGAGHMKTEFDDAGIPWRPLGERIEQLEATARELRRRFADDVSPRPVQEPLPLAIGAMSRRGLAVAANHADIISFAGLRQQQARPPDAFTVATSEQTDGLVAYVNDLRSERPYEADMLLQAVQIDIDPDQAASELAARVPGLDPQRLLDSPFVLLARDAHEGAARLQRRSERWGFTSVTAFWPSIDALQRVRNALPAGRRQKPQP
jgi:probable F420-dependent oxidoreductase